MIDEERRARRSANQKRYAATAKGRAVMLAAEKRYRESPKGLAAAAARGRKYRQSEKYKAWAKAYYARPEVLKRRGRKPRPPTRPILRLPILSPALLDHGS